MSIKKLALLVFVMVAGVLASVHSYLAADRKLACEASDNTAQCCACLTERPAFDPDAEAMTAGVERDSRRVLERSALAFRRREATAQPHDS